jgi:hypothetical protein
MPMHLAGTPLLNVALDRGSREASRRILPAALAVSLLILAVVLRRIAGVVAVMCAVGVTTLWTTGLMVLAGRTFNMVTVTLPSLLTVLSLSAGIHIVLRIQSLVADAGDHRAAVRRTIREVLPAIFLSNVTTAVGFGSLLVSDMQPVADFGLFAAIGMLLSFLFNATIVPGVLSWLRAGSLVVFAMPTHWTAPLGRAVASGGSGSCLGHRCAGCLLAAHDRTPRRIERAEVLPGRFADQPGLPLRRRAADRPVHDRTGCGGGLAKRKRPAQADRTARDRPSHARPEVAQVIHYKSIATSLDAIRQSALVTMAGASENPLRLLSRK